MAGSARRSTPAGEPGDSVAVIGCGGVGDAAVLGARLAGAHTIIAVDVDLRKLEWARQFGATHGRSRETHPVEEIQLTDGNGADVVIEVVGRRTPTAGVLRRDLGRVLVWVGVRTPDMRSNLPLMDLSPRWRAEVDLVRRLPAGTDLPMPPALPAGPVAAGEFVSKRSRSTTSRPAPRDAPRRRAPLGRKLDQLLVRIAMWSARARCSTARMRSATGRTPS